MDALVVDLTHGGVKIAVELEKLGQFDNIFAYDIYATLKENEKNILNSYNIKLLSDENDLLNFISSFIENLEINNSKISNNNNHNNNYNNYNNLLLINPIHSSFNIFDIIDNKKYNSINSFNSKTSIKYTDSINSSDFINSIKEITHHKAVSLILNNWKKKIKNENVPVIEVTGVKGKTSVVGMLKEILIKKNPLVLSSLGANLYKNDKKIILKKNISITPASILTTVRLAKRIDNSQSIRIHKSSQYIKNQKNDNLSYGVCIFESSLGGTGLGDVGILTNMVENYPIAKNTSNASNAKEQIFNSDIITIEKETLEKYYSEKMDNDYKINTFSFGDETANLFVKELKFDLNSTNIKILYNDIKTISGKTIDGYLDINTFAPGKHHVLNVLATVTGVLSCDINENIIINRLANFRGIKGRTSIKTQEGQIIIEEINPGINTKAIEKSINMINNLNDYVVIFGGKYGVTCEEIDEDKVAILFDNFFDNFSQDKLENSNFNTNNDFKLNLLLTDELGNEIKKKMKNSVKFVNDPYKAQKLASEYKKNILFIYRSNYSQINKR